MIWALAVALVAAVVTASSEFSRLAALDVSRVLSGEYWRLLSGHLTHLSWSQYALDAPVFVLLYATYQKRVSQQAALLLALFAALVVSLAVVFAGRHQVYGGLSGVSCAALSALLIELIRERPGRALPYLLGLIYCVYLLFLGGVAAGVRVAREAHLAGAVTGVVFALCRLRVASAKNRAKPGSQPHLM